MSFHIKTIIRHSDNDEWENGCTLESASDFPEWEIPQSFETPAALLAYIAKKTGESDKSTYLFDSCDETGRIDVQFNALTHGAKKASAADIEEWKAGRVKMRLVGISFYIEERRTPSTAEWVD